MFKVYWTEPLTGESTHQDFDDMGEALNWMQSLRNIYNATFVCMSSDNPDNVTKMGVADVGPGYNWKKRRI